MSERIFLGAGMKFPPQIDQGTGRFKVSSGLESVKESVYIILMTQFHERWLRPDFGSNVISYTFTDITPTVVTMMKHDITESILKNEPRIVDVDVDITDGKEPGKLVISVDYYVAGEYTKDSLVFPFYINADREVAGDEF